MVNQISMFLTNCSSTKLSMIKIYLLQSLLRRHEEDGEITRGSNEDIEDIKISPISILPSFRILVPSACQPLKPMRLVSFVPSYVEIECKIVNLLCLVPDKVIALIFHRRRLFLAKY